MEQNSNSNSIVDSSNRSRNNGYYNSNDQQQQDPRFHKQIQQMIFHLKQEQLSPQLLYFQKDLFQKLKDQIKQQQQRIKTFKNQRQHNQQSLERRNLKTVIYTMEVQRVSFILKQYLRIRLDKIQKCSFHYFKNISTAEKLMSENQRVFLKKYVDLRYKFYQQNILQHMAKNLRGIGGIQLFLSKPQQIKIVNSNQSNSNVVEPDVKSYVFAKLNRNSNQFRYRIDIPIYDIPEEESSIASSNDILFIPYKDAKALIEKSTSREDIVLI